MKNDLNKKTTALFAAAVILTIGLNAGSALAYFTACAEAKGSAKIEFGTPGPEVEETFADWIKTVTVVNNGDAPCYVRIKVAAGNLCSAGMAYEYDAAKWTPKDGYYYYNDILQPGDKAAEIRIHVPVPDADAEDFNVIVAEEYAPVVRDGEGNPCADWDLKAAAADTDE